MKDESIEFKVEIPALDNTRKALRDLYGICQLMNNNAMALNKRIEKLEKDANCTKDDGGKDEE